MARRSARLLKQRSPTPADNVDDSWQTASPEPQRLPSVLESEEPAMKTPKKAAKKNVDATPAATPTVAPATPRSHLPQPTKTATPLKNASPPKPSLSVMAAQTPTSRIKPAGEEMHPAQHHATTAKMLDEARWLGFQAIPSTAPPKQLGGLGIGNTTPSRTPAPAANKTHDIVSSPDFRFRFRSPIPGLSPQSNRILNDGRAANSTATPGRAIFKADEFSAPADVSPRKLAVPKGKSNRFSDVHMANFKKMDSIANHPSAFRADPSRFKPVGASLKRSPSKADLDKADTTPTTKTPNKLKRTQSKMDMNEPSVSQPALKLQKATPMPKRVQSKPDVTPSTTRLPQSTVRFVPPARDSRPSTRDGSAPTPVQDGPTAKRVKRVETDDAASTRPISRDGSTPSGIPTASRPKHSRFGLPQAAARLMTPTKSSMARSQSAKAIKTTSMIPSLAQSPSVKNLLSPINIGQTMKDGFRKTSNSLQRVRSILRTPSRKFSDDPSKIAAGTHVTPPAGLDLLKALPNVPKTAPIQKHVNFSTSTLERAAHDALGKSPSPMKFRAGSEIPTGAVLYPKLTSVEYPALPNEVDTTVGSPSRRLTFGGASDNTPAKFDFKSDKNIDFGPVSASTIRVVRKSDASSLTDAKKRKADSLEEISDKENSRPTEDEGRGAKRLKASPIKPPKTPSTLNKTPRRLPKSAGGISQSRLAFLATPKRAKPFTVASFNNLIDDLKKSYHSLKNHPLLSSESSPPGYSNDVPTDAFSQIYLKFHELLHNTGSKDITAFFTNPRLNDPAYLTTLAILLAAIFTTMSWFSRTGGNWGGRFSPFGRSNNTGGNQVGDEDFSYITSEDLANATGKGGRHRASSRAAEIVDWDDKDPDRKTDVLIFKNGRTNYPTHFAVQSIRDGSLRIGDVREAAAKKIGVSDPSRIRMFFKGKNLKHDERTAREEGLRGDGAGSEILCVIGEAGTGTMAPGSEDTGMPGTAHRSWSDDEDEDDTEDANDSGAGGGPQSGKKKPRKRGGKKNKKKGGASTGTSTPGLGYSNASSANAEFLPIPSHIGGAPRSGSAPPPSRAPPTPQTPIGKLDAIASKFHTELVPLCVTFLNNPPEEKAKREFEHKKLSETVLAQVLLKLDGVETEGDPDARAKRKALVKEVQGMLNSLDEAVKKA
ncbi:hypothetical protein BU24DRAFT_487173 [Aaosphaeria arxii CBS 175.79]|uniref:BAG domain-containing protein n=1 Tax=Aaosphaeria arxii CBS 175.79 TaxID=1450172 RepID=A0A6A5Y503_9PLEO|nr:uncharacterized protein BU24DRAFT_487173 [Aaosphaeria arxii CBS 175.79]KAF2020588.1 hypothetical protein BU24DRAFT_487173 [Aaosphaeria arxii CBS 175.79]